MALVERLIEGFSRAAQEIKSVRAQMLSRPYITASGPLDVGTVLTCVTPWFSSTYQWYRNGVAISGATASTYMLKGADSFADITCVASGGGFVSPVVPMPEIISNEIHIEGLPVWSEALTDVKNGVRNARLLILSDSIANGYRTNGEGYENNEKTTCWPTKLAQMITTEGQFVASWSSMVGNGNVPAQSLYDHRFSSNTWGTTTGSGAEGQVTGGYNLMSVGTPTTLNFTPLNACDTFEIYYPVFNVGDWSNTGWKLSVNGGTKDPTHSAYSPSGNGALTKATITRPLGANTLNIIANDSEYTFLSGVVAYNSAVKEISILNAGWGGARVVDLINSNDAGKPLGGIAVYNPDLVIVCIGGNDVSTSESAFKTAYQILIDHIKGLGCDLLMVIQTPLGGGYTAQMETISGWVASLATLNSVPVHDLRTKFGSFATANAAGWYHSDGIHPNGTGAIKIAESFFERLHPA